MCSGPGVCDGILCGVDGGYVAAAVVLVVVVIVMVMVMMVLVVVLDGRWLL